MMNFDKLYLSLGLMEIVLYIVFFVVKFLNNVNFKVY